MYVYMYTGGKQIHSYIDLAPIYWWYVVAIVLYITLPVSKLDPATPCPVPHPLLNFISGISLLVCFSFSGLTRVANLL